MVCLGLEPKVAVWKAETNPLSYGGTPSFYLNVYCLFSLKTEISFSHFPILL